MISHNYSIAIKIETANKADKNVMAFNFWLKFSRNFDVIDVRGFFFVCTSPGQSGHQSIHTSRAKSFPCFLLPNFEIVCYLLLENIEQE